MPWPTFPCFIFTTTPPGRHAYYLHFTDEETERLRGLEDSAQGHTVSCWAGIRWTLPCVTVCPHRISWPRRDHGAESTSMIINQSSLQGRTAPWRDPLLTCAGSFSAGRCPFTSICKVGDFKPTMDPNFWPQNQAAWSDKWLFSDLCHYLYGKFCQEWKWKSTCFRV